MTEYEINKAVAEKLCVNEEYTTFIPDGRYSFDPCNNAQQAWEIMINNNISVIKFFDSFIAIHYLLPNIRNVPYVNRKASSKPLVAAMLLFLEI